ncbi:MAG: EthD family reductase [Armatimonadota bacterium]|nr:EthD family reductase [Armatimonadota bacterium]MDR5697490.1 EthD family reductase [Armatimonadota bacterium]
MVKLVALYRPPSDPKAFDEHYFNVHVPLNAKTPNLRRVEISRVTGSPMGGQAPYYMMAEMYFDDAEAMREALASPEARAAGRDLMSFARDLVVLMTAEVVE